jgi:hypothetical protein
MLNASMVARYDLGELEKDYGERSTRKPWMPTINGRLSPFGSTGTV